MREAESERVFLFLSFFLKHGSQRYVTGVLNSGTKLAHRLFPIRSDGKRHESERVFLFLFPPFSLSGSCSVCPIQVREVDHSIRFRTSFREFSE